MPDIVDAWTRSRMMSGIRGSNTQPELRVRRFLHRHGFRDRLHVKDLPGRPDIVLPKYKAVVFVHGCFWHRHSGCPYAYRPKSNVEFWEAKLNSNAERDARVEQKLAEQGWQVLVVWECDTSQGRLEALANDLARD